MTGFSILRRTPVLADRGGGVFGGFFIYSATREEAYLAGEFPDAYPAYKRSTKMLVPFIF